MIVSFLTKKCRDLFDWLRGDGSVETFCYKATMLCVSLFFLLGLLMSGALIVKGFIVALFSTPADMCGCPGLSP